MSELDRQFDHLSLGHNGAQGGSPQPQQSQQSYDASANGGAPSSSEAPRSPFHSNNAYGAQQQQQQQAYGTASAYDSQQQQQQAGDSQSASARFERFFASPPPEATSPYLGTGSIGQQGGGYAAGGTGGSAFGSFGHALPGGAGSGHFGSQSGSRRAAGGGVARGSIPSQWDPTAPSNPQQQGYYAMQPPQQSQAGGGSGFLSHAGAGPADDDIISTAIVVKNIPFSVQKEQLLQIIEDLNIPMPYAFNYHFDGGNFRGLAFANFRSGEEADAVVAALNGFDVAGRKLRVEYKKVLQPGEKERIEKEKAIKRMQSMQLEKERSRHGEWANSPDLAAAYDPYAMPGLQQPPMPTAQPAQLQQPQQQQQQEPSPTMTSPTMEIHPPYGAPAEQQQQQQQTGRLPLTADSLRAVPSSANLSVANGAGAARSERSGGASTRAKEELDLNDAGTLEIYSRVLLFKDDRMRDELSFSRSLSPLERRTVHLVAQRLGLYHYSMGEGEERYVVVTKNEVQQGHRPLRSQASTIGRSTRGLLDPNASLLGPGSSATTGRAGLRGKKSAPDMKRARDEPGGYGGGFGGANGGLAVPGAANLARKSNGNLREGYAATMGRSSRSGAGAAGLQNLFSSSPFDVPPVPSLPSPSNPSGIGHASSPSGGGGGSIRQPRGPPTQSGDSRNFAPRARVTVGASAGAALQAAAAQQQQQQQQQYAAQAQQEEYGNAHAGLSPDDVRSHEPLEI